MISIVCLKWGSLYGPSYVNFLYNEVEKYVTIPHEFICFTENKEGVICKTSELPNLNVQGWWNKLWLFNELPVKYSRIFFMDLDTIIVENIDNILSNLKDDNFYIARNWWPNKHNNYASGLMSWINSKETAIYETFANSDFSTNWPGHGDQGFIEFCKKDVIFFQDEFPDMFVSYKAHYKKGQRAKMIYFHGNPRPHKVPELWNSRP